MHTEHLEFASCTDGLSASHLRALTSVRVFPRLRGLAFDACAASGVCDETLVALLRRRVHGLEAFTWRRAIEKRHPTMAVLDALASLCASRDKDEELRRIQRAAKEQAKADAAALGDRAKFGGSRRNAKAGGDEATAATAAAGEDEDDEFPEPVNFLHLELVDLPASCCDAALVQRLLQSLPAPPGAPAHAAPPLRSLALERSAGSKAAELATDEVLLAARRCVNLRTLSLAGSQAWTGMALVPLLAAAPRLNVLRLDRCAQVNDLLISLIARTLSTRLEEIYLIDCPRLSRVSLDVLVTTCPHLKILECNSFPGVQLG